jgi:hypothetical protein
VAGVRDALEMLMKLKGKRAQQDLLRAWKSLDDVRYCFVRFRLFSAF